MKIEDNPEIENEDEFCEPWRRGKKCDCGKGFIHWFESGEFSIDECIPCPVCSCNFVLPVSVRVYPLKGDTEYEINSKGISTRSSDAAETHRGISIVIQFYCDDGHIWDTHIRFHKGETALSNILIEEVGFKELDSMISNFSEMLKELPQVIWRD